MFVCVYVHTQDSSLCPPLEQLILYWQVLSPHPNKETIKRL